MPTIASLVIFEKGAAGAEDRDSFRGMFTKAFTEEPVWGEFRIGNVFTMTVLDLDDEAIEYGFRMDSGFPHATVGHAAIHRFDPNKVLLDPYARAIGGRDVWGQAPDWNAPFPHRSRDRFRRLRLGGRSPA